MSGKKPSIEERLLAMAAQISALQIVVSDLLSVRAAMTGNPVEWLTGAKQQLTKVSLEAGARGIPGVNSAMLDHLNAEQEAALMDLIDSALGRLAEMGISVPQADS